MKDIEDLIQKAVELQSNGLLPPRLPMNSTFQEKRLSGF